MNKFSLTAAKARAKALTVQRGESYVVLNDNHYDSDLPAKWIAVSYNAWFYRLDNTPYIGRYEVLDDDNNVSWTTDYE